MRVLMVKTVLLASLHGVLHGSKSVAFIVFGNFGFLTVILKEKNKNPHPCLAIRESKLQKNMG